MTDLNEFVGWSKDNPRCSVKIEIDAGKVNMVWVYSYHLMTGQIVSSVDEIDLEAEYKKNMEQKRQEVEKYFQEKEVVV